jgi:hypothetical protein
MKGSTIMRGWMRSLAATLLLGGVLSGCGGQKADLALENSADSLLASNPTEQTTGDITPQTEYQPEPSAPQTAPAPKPTPKPASPKPSSPKPAPGVTVPAGTGLKISVDTKISSETAQPGDTWTGTVNEAIVIGTAAPIPAGATVSGVVTGTKGAEKGDRAFLVLGVRSITVDGKTHSISATADSIIAGSTRARNLGAIAGSAAAGALIGKAVGGSGKGALIGGLIGGAAATGAVAKSKGFQVELKEGTELVFHVNEAVVMR